MALTKLDGSALGSTAQDLLGSRNLIVNGACNVAQRGTTSTSTAYATVDRMYYTHNGVDEACTQAQHALTSSDTGPWAAGFRNSYHITNGNQTGGAGAADVIITRYRIEAQDLANSGWDYTSSSSYITFSFWVKASVAQTYYVRLETQDGTAQNYSFAIALSANTWTKITKTIPGNSNLQFDNDANSGLKIEWTLYRGTDSTTSGHTNDTWAAYASSSRVPDMTSTWYTTNDATFEYTGIQLEVGNSATEFEHRSLTDELARCYRYYYLHASGTAGPVCSSANYSATHAFGFIPFPVEMRTTATLDKVTGTNYFRAYANAGSDQFDNVALQSASTLGYVLQCDTNISLTAGSASWIETNNASARIAFTAEI